VVAVLMGGGSLAQLPLAQIAVLIALFCALLRRRDLHRRRARHPRHHRRLRVLRPAVLGLHRADGLGPTTNFVLVAVPLSC
jgi:hypothetical protein